MEETTFDLIGLNDDVLGVVMRLIIDRVVLYAVAMASQRFYAVFTKALKMAAATPIMRGHRFTNLVSGEFTPSIDMGLFTICDQLISSCYIRDAYQCTYPDEIYAIYFVIHSKCDACGRYLDLVCRNNKFFKLQLIDIHNDIVDNIDISTTEICKLCVGDICDNAEVAHATRTYYLHYVGGRAADRIIQLRGNYKVRKLTFIARVPFVVDNPDL